MAGTSVALSQPGAWCPQLSSSTNNFEFSRCAKSMAGWGVTVRSFFETMTNDLRLDCRSRALHRSAERLRDVECHHGLRLANLVIRVGAFVLGRSLRQVLHHLLSRRGLVEVFG